MEEGDNKIGQRGRKRRYDYENMGNRRSENNLDVKGINKNIECVINICLFVG
jgi:hypothetical protein